MPGGFVTGGCTRLGHGTFGRRSEAGPETCTQQIRELSMSPCLSLQYITWDEFSGMIEMLKT